MPVESTSADPPYPSHRRAWLGVALLLAAYTVALVDRQILSLMVKPIRADFGITDTQLSLLAGFAFVLFYSTLGLPCGRLADVTNRKIMIVVGMVLWCLATIGCGLADTYAELFVARMLVGVGEATLGPAAYSIIADSFPPGPRARAVSTYTMGVFMGTGSALIFSAAAIAATSDSSGVVWPVVGALHTWQAAFLIVGAPGLLVALAIALGIREPVRRDRTAGSSPSLRAAVGFVLKNASLLVLLLLGYGLNGLINYGLTTWAPTLFIRRFGWTAASIGTTYGFLLLTLGSAGVLTGGWLAGRVPPHGPHAVRISKAAMLVLVPLIAILAAASEPWVALLALGALAFVIGIPAAIAPVALYQVTPNEFRGQVIAFYLLAATLLGLGFGVTLIAATTDHVFQRDSAIGLSLATVLIPAAILSYLAMARAARILEKTT